MLMFVALTSFAQQKVLDDSQKKICWAHAVAWGFDMKNAYGKDGVMLQFNDAPFGKPEMQTDAGKWADAKTPIIWALNYDIDGIMVDIPILKVIPKVMSRYFKAAEGTKMKIALCMDNIWGENQVIADTICTYMDKFGKHPNASYVDGRHVIFIYNPDAKTPEEWKEISALVKKRGYNPFYLTRAIFECNPSRPENEIIAQAQAYDGFYDFGSSGLHYETMLSRLAMQKKALDKVAKETSQKRLFCPSIAQGYNERRTSFYRPYLGSRTIRHNWLAAIATKADWVSLTTWDDYGETTVFEPSQNCGDASLVLNSHYLRVWRGQEIRVATNPDAVVGYKPDIVDGSDLLIDISALPHKGDSTYIYLRLLKPNGDILRYEEIKADPSKLDVFQIIIADSEMLTWNDVRVQMAITKTPTSAEEIAWKELRTITRRPARPLTYAPYRALLSKTDKADTIELSVKSAKDKKFALVKFAKAASGRLEVLRNSRVVGATQVNLPEGGEVKVELPSRAGSRCDVYQARFAYEDFRFALSKPRTSKMKNLPRNSSKTPIIVLNTDFDMNWPLWEPHTRPSPEKVDYRKIPENRIFSATFDFEEKNDAPKASAKSWNITAKLGAERVRSRRTPYLAPKRATDSIGNAQKQVLEFAGKEALTFENNSTPQGVYTVEMLIKVKNIGKAMPLFTDWRTFETSINAEGNPVFLIVETTNSLEGTEKIEFEKWTHLAFVNNGKIMKIYINGNLVGNASCSPIAKYLGSAPIFGAPAPEGAENFHGMLGGISFEGTERSPDKFKLLKFLDLQK